MSTHFAAASMLPTMLPNVAPPTLPGLPIIQTSQIPGLGNVGVQPPQMPGLGGTIGVQSTQMHGLGNIGGQAPKVVPASPAKPMASPLISASLAVSKASEVSDAKDSPFSTFARSVLVALSFVIHHLKYSSFSVLLSVWLG